MWIAFILIGTPAHSLPDSAQHILGVPGPATLGVGDNRAENVTRRTVPHCHAVIAALIDAAYSRR